MTTKAERIRDLLQQGKSYSEIVGEVGCGRPYVRTVKQRMDGGGQTAADRRWTKDVASQRYRTDPVYREKALLWARAQHRRFVATYGVSRQTLQRRRQRNEANYE